MKIEEKCLYEDLLKKKRMLKINISKDKQGIKWAINLLWRMVKINKLGICYLL